jgi:hypothetical protein
MTTAHVRQPDSPSPSQIHVSLTVKTPVSLHSCGPVLHACSPEKNPRLNEREEKLPTEETRLRYDTDAEVNPQGM